MTLLNQLLELKGQAAAPESFAKLARAHRQGGALDQADEVVRKGLAQYPHDAALLREAAEGAMAAENWAGAAERWEQAIDTLGDEAPPILYSRLARCKQHSDDFGAADDILSCGLAKHAGSAVLLNDVAELAVIMRRARGFRASSQRDRAPGPSLTIECICKSFWAIEDRLALLDWTVHEAFPWPLLRMALFYALAQKAGLYQQPHPALSSVMRPKRDRSKARHRNVLPSNRILRAVAYVKLATRGHHAILMSTRRTGGAEVYTSALRAELGGRALLFDRPCGGTVAKGAVNFEDLIKASREKYMDKHIVLAFRDRMLCEEIREQFFDQIGIDIGDLAKICQNRIASFLALRKGFTDFFEIHPVKMLFLTNAYALSARAFLEGARAQGARIVELQHGTISPFHLGYSWPRRPDVPYSPDELWCFGNFWPESTPLPAKTGSRVIGAPYVHELAAKAEGTPRDEHLVVFASQGVVGQHLFGMALEAARRRPDFRIVFRLHPSELLDEYQVRLEECDQVPSNFSLSHCDPNIFALLATAAIQVGVFSTTLFEGISLGTRTVVVDLPGAEYMRPVIRRGEAILVRTVDQLVAALDQAPIASDPEYYYSKPVARLV